MELGKKKELAVKYNNTSLLSIPRGEFDRPIHVEVFNNMVDVFYGEEIVFSLVHELDADEIIVYGDLNDDEATDHYVLN